jgi:outer membrane protein assembly factor BamB
MRRNDARYPLVRFVAACLLPVVLSYTIGCKHSVADDEGQPSPAAGSQSSGEFVDIGTRTRGSDWPQFLGPDQNGVSTETGIRTDWTGNRLPVVWTRDFSTSYGIGSVARGRYYHFDRVQNRERLSCLNVETGETLWEVSSPVDYEDMYGYNNGPRTSPTIDGNRVYTMGVAGRLTCRSAVDGSELWNVPTNDRYGVVQNFFGVGCSPLIVDDLVIVMVGGSPPEDQRLPPGRLDRVTPNGSAIVAFDKLTGDERYRVGENLASYSTLRTMRLADKTLILGFVREGLLGVDARSGEQLWMFPWRADMLESVNAAVPVVDDNQVLISECYAIGSALLQVDANDYRVVRSDPDNRRLQSLRAHWATPIKVGNFLYGSSGRNQPDSDLRCVDWESGKVQWTDDRRERTSLLGIDGYLIVLGERGVMELIEATPEAYRPLTSIDLSVAADPPTDRPAMRYPFWAAPIVSHGLLLVRGESRVTCFELIPDGPTDTGESP